MANTHRGGGYCGAFAALLMLFVAVTASSQTPAARTVMAEKAWADFWHQFTLAMNKKDHAALLRMMPSDFSATFSEGGGLTAREWLKLIDQNDSHLYWEGLRKSMAGGAKINRARSAKGVPTKVTQDNQTYFEYRKDGKWYFARSWAPD